MHLVNAKQMQEMDKFTIQEFGIPGIVLMENAGKGAAQMFIRVFQPDASTRIAIMAGRGNNGGDGFVIARYLANKGFPVTVFLMAPCDKVSGDAKTNIDLYKNMLPHCPKAKLIEIPNDDCLVSKKNNILHQNIFVDALLGTGLNAPVAGRFYKLIQWMNESRKPVFSVDIASGLNADNGKPQGIAVKAKATATFAHAKIGHVLYPGNEYTGQLEIIDIGIPSFVSNEIPGFFSVPEKNLIREYFPTREFNSHKGTFGHVLTIAGSKGKTGAASLCANAAARSGAGLVTLGCPESLNPIMEPQITEPMSVGLQEFEQGIISSNAIKEILTLAKDKQVLAIGPGLGTHEQIKDLVKDIIKSINIPMIIDADALNCIADQPDILSLAKAPVVITPHPGEMARLCKTSSKQIQEDRLTFARNFAQEFNTTVVLKGAQTLVALSNGKIICCTKGNPGMASGGMGDVLTGIIAGFTAQGLPAEKAAIAGVYIHGLAGDMLTKKIGNFGFLASDLLKTIPVAIQETLINNNYNW